MKSISAALKAYMAQEVTTLATCWRIERTDGQEFFFTDHDVDIEYDGDTYESDSGMMPSAFSQTRGAATDNMEAFSFLESDKITEFDLQQGLYNDAIVDVFMINYQDTSMGVMYIIRGGIIGEVTIKDTSFTAEVRGKTQRLGQKTVDFYGPTCRAKLGDAQCGIDTDDAAYNYAGTVTEIDSSDDRRTFSDSGTIDSASGADAPYMFGLITWTSSASGNDGLTMEVRSFDPSTGTFELFQGMPYSIQVGDEFNVRFGCDKRRETCIARFDNIVNFRGEPFIPGSVILPPASEEGRKASRRGMLRPI